MSIEYLKWLGIKIYVFGCREHDGGTIETVSKIVRKLYVTIDKLYEGKTIVSICITNNSKYQVVIPCGSKSLILLNNCKVIQHGMCTIQQC